MEGDKEIQSKSEKVEMEGRTGRQRFSEIRLI